MVLDKSQVVGEINVQYKIAGSGPALLMLHGWGRGSGAYVQVMELLAGQGYQVIAPDLPGFGKTPPPQDAWGVTEYSQFVFQFSQKLSLTKFFLLGHSFGGQIAVQFAADHPELLQGLILYAAAVIRREPGAVTRAIQSIARLGNSILSIPPLSLFKSPMRRLFYKLFGISGAVYSKGIMKAVRKKVIRQDLSRFLPNISHSVLILWGDKDKSTPLADAYFMKEKIPQASLVVFPGATHLIHQEVPEEFVSSITSFLSHNR